MVPRRRNLLLASAFSALLLLHAWLVVRSMSRGDFLLAAILSAAVAIFLQRIAHHLRRAKGSAPRTTRVDRDERKHILTWSAILIALLPAHGFLLVRFVDQGEVILSSLLAVAIAMMVIRLGWYGWRYIRLSGELRVADRPREVRDLPRG